MYPVAPASFILFVERILVSLSVKLLLENFSCAQEPAMINENAQSGRRMNV
jgi:hypothetical protein